MQNNSQKKEKGKFFKHWIIFTITCCLLLIFVGYIGSYKVKEYIRSEEAEELIWEKCQQEDTYLEYSKYIVSYPNGKYNKEALDRMDELKEKENSLIKQ